MVRPGANKIGVEYRGKLAVDKLQNWTVPCAPIRHLVGVDPVTTMWVNKAEYEGKVVNFSFKLDFEGKPS